MSAFLLPSFVGDHAFMSGLHLEFLSLCKQKRGVSNNQNTMTVLSYADLDAACVVAAVPSPFYSRWLTETMPVLYNTGCRPVELLDHARWTFNGVSVFTLQPAKGNNLRTINWGGAPLYFRQWVLYGSGPFNYVTLSKMSNLFSHQWPLPQCFVGDKQSDLYLFRYRYVKWLADRGFTDSQIQTAMGWTNVGMVSSYKNAVVFYL